MELSFAEQIKIILKRKNMTIQDLALLYEAQTGVKMTRQNLSQRLRRDNFPEQDMHLLASMLGYQVSIQLTPLNIPTHPEHTVSFVQTAAPQNTAPPAPAAPAVQKIVTADGSTVEVPKLLKKQPPVLGDINPLTGQEYLTNTVRSHPQLDGYVQVYDRSIHEWNDVNENYFWEFQANKKEILGSDYQEPILI